jgi:glycosyltransferase involved in cell wall biosynthesis
MVYRHYYLSREWVRLGHEVTVVASSFAHVRTSNPRVEGPVTEEYIDGIRYLWLKTPRYHESGVGRLRNIVTFLARLFGRCGTILREFSPDIIIASSTYVLDIFPAYLMAMRSKATLVYEVRDLWPLTPVMVGGLSRWHPFVLTLRVAEYFAYSRADRVVSVLPHSKDYLKSKGMKAEKFVHIPNGLDPCEWPGETLDLPSEHARTLSRLRDEGRFIVGYAGAHGLAADLSTLIKAAGRLRDHPVAVVLVGKGRRKGSLKQEAAARGLENVFFLPSVPRSGVPALLAGMDALYIGLKKYPLFRYGVSPNKLFDYLMAGKPVIYALDCGNDIVAQVRCGISVEPEDADALAKAVEELRQTDRQERAAMGMRGRQYVIAHHDVARLARRFLEQVQCRFPAEASEDTLA